MFQLLDRRNKTQLFRNYVYYVFLELKKLVIEGENILGIVENIGNYLWIGWLFIQPKQISSQILDAKGGPTFPVYHLRCW